ncbi:MAG: hypothetical protein ACREE2_14825 [Stellaceae bacterium]
MLRRNLLGAAAVAVAAAAVSRPARSRPTVSQREARYQDRPNGGFSCAACALFRPPSSCTVVAGTISPHGWCRFFDLPD